MPRAYLRTLPDLYERKAFGTDSHPPYPPAAIACFLGVLCFGEQQPQRGRFKSRRLLVALLEGPAGEGRAIARQVSFLIDQGDLVQMPGGGLYIEGWDELQEGNWQVAERMARYRGRTKGVTPPVTVGVTVPVTVAVTDDPSRVDSGKRLAVSEERDSTPAPPNDPWEDAEGEAVTWLARHGCDIPPHSGYYRHLVTMVEAHGINAVIGMFDRLADAGMKNGDVKGYVFSARDALDSKTRPSLVDIAKTERSEDVRAATRRAVENTRRYIAELEAAKGPA